MSRNVNRGGAGRIAAENLGGRANFFLLQTSAIDIYSTEPVLALSWPALVCCCLSLLSSVWRAVIKPGKHYHTIELLANTGSLGSAPDVQRGRLVRPVRVRAGSQGGA